MAVRREKVLLQIESDLAPVMARDAIAAKTLEKALRDLDGTSVRTSRSMSPLGSPNGPIGGLGTQSGRAVREVDRVSGRLRLLTDTALTLGPALIPIGAVGIPAMAGLAAQFGAAAIAGGTALVAFQGVGTALEAVNKAALEPTTENLAAAREAMQSLDPAAREFVRTLQDMRPAFQAVRDAAAAGLFPGLTESLTELETVLPKVERIVYAVGDALGDLAADSAESLAGPRWAEFFRFVETEIPSALTELGRTVGNVTHGLAELWMAFTPLNRDFSRWLLDASAAFDQWASSLAQTDGFAEFMAYVRENGPRVADALGAVGNALLQIVQAAAPLGGPVLQALEAVADAIATIAGSDAGPAIMATVTALTLLNRGMSAFGAAGQSAWVQNIKGANGFVAAMGTARQTAIRGTAALAGLGIAATGAADGIGLTNTASGALMGMVAGPWGAAVGGAIGLTLDLAASQGEAAAKVDGLTATLDRQTGAATDLTYEWAAQKIVQNDVADAADRLGLSSRVLADALLGTSDAGSQLYAQVLNMSGSLAEGSDAQRGYANEVLGFLDKYGPEARKQMETARLTAEITTEATSQMAEGYGVARFAAQQFRLELARVNRVLEGRAGLRDYQAALDDFTKSVKENGDTLDRTTAKGRANEAALDAIAASALKVAENMRSTNRVEFLAQARRDFVDAAKKLLGGRDAAQALADKLGLVNRTDARPRIDIDTANAFRAIGGIQSALRGIPDEDVWVTVRRRQAEGSNGSFGPQLGAADGATVPGPRYPYGDKVPAFLAPGEEVISNRFGQADRHRDLLKAINANRLADGGTAWREAERRATRHSSPMVVNTGGDQMVRALSQLAGEHSADRTELQRLRAEVKALRKDVHVAAQESGVTFGKVINGAVSSAARRQRL